MGFNALFNRPVGKSINKRSALLPVLLRSERFPQEFYRFKDWLATLLPLVIATTAVSQFYLNPLIFFILLILG